MEENIIYQYVRECEEEYKEFFGLKHFPKYEIIYKEIYYEKAEQQGYDSFATAFYDVPTGKHILEIWSKLYTLELAGKAVVFHELTHIYDDDVMVQNDKKRYLGNHAYEEYHASQVELLKLLRVKNIHDTFMFLMRDKIDIYNICENECYNMKEVYEELKADYCPDTPHSVILKRAHVAENAIRRSVSDKSYNGLKQESCIRLEDVDFVPLVYHFCTDY